MAQIWIAALLAAGSGALVPVQAAANVQLGRTLGHPLWAALASLVLATAVIIPLLAAVRPPAPSVGAAAGGPLWIWSGGLIGACYITAAILLAPQLGAGTVVGAVIAGQMVSALVLDHFDLGGFQHRPADLLRIAGAGLTVLGATLVQAASRPGQP